MASLDFLGPSRKRHAQRRQHEFAGDRAVGGCAPGQRHGRELRVARLDQLERRLFERPGSPERSPLFEVHVLQAVAVEFPHRPSRGVFESRRSGEPRAVNVGQVSQGLHHLGTFEGLGFDAIDDPQIDVLLSQRRHRQQESKDCGFSHSRSIQRRVPMRRSTRGTSGREALGTIWCRPLTLRGHGRLAKLLTGKAAYRHPSSSVSCVVYTMKM